MNLCSIQLRRSAEFGQLPSAAFDPPFGSCLVGDWGGGCLFVCPGRKGGQYIPQDQCIQNEFPRKALKRESKLTLLIMIFNDFLIFATVF